MTRSEPHAHGIGMRITVIVLSVLLAVMVVLYFATTAKIADGAAHSSRTARRRPVTARKSWPLVR